MTRWRWAASSSTSTPFGTSSPRPSLLERTQERVEAASIVLGLHESRPWLWDELDSATQEHVVAWLSDFIGTSGYGNNWVWFQNVAEAFLRTVGGPWLTTASGLRGAVEVRIVRIDGWDLPAAGTQYPTETAPTLPEDPDGHWPADTGPWRTRRSNGGMSLMAPTSWRCAGHPVISISSGWTATRVTPLTHDRTGLHS